MDKLVSYQCIGSEYIYAEGVESKLTWMYGNVDAIKGGKLGMYMNKWLVSRTRK